MRPNDKFCIQFWGVRGTFPIPGKKTLYYGGNTSCITLAYNNSFFIFDAGTGIKNLSNYLIAKKKLPISAKIFITHPHYDHINGIPFFAPLYMKGNKFEFFGANHSETNVKELISNQMNNIYFPVTIKEFSAKLSFNNITRNSFYVDDLHIQTISLNHPGGCLGYRVQHKNKSFCYLTDNELYLENSPQYNQQAVNRVIDFIQDTDLAVMDATYSNKAYLKKIGWGHSCIGRVVDVASKANVKLLCLHHHDLDNTDKDIDLKLKFAKTWLKAHKSKTRCIAPREGEIICV